MHFGDFTVCTCYTPTMSRRSASRSAINMAGGSSSTSISSLVFAVTLGAVLSYLIFSRQSTPNNPGSFSGSVLRRNAVDRAFYLGVVIIFPDLNQKQQFINIFTPLANYVKEKELGTLSYELLESDKDPKRILISERYQSREYYLTVHKTSSEFLQFREGFQQLIANGTVVDGHSYYESGIGIP